MDGEVRKKEVAKLRKRKLSRANLIADLKTNHRAYVRDAKELDINLDSVLDMMSPGKDPALQHVLEDLNLAMIDTASRPSSKIMDLKDHNSLADVSVAAYMQRLYTIGSRFPSHPLVATFTLTPIAGGTVFNPYSVPPAGVREKEEIEPEVDYTQFLAESWSTLDDTERIPFYEDKVSDRQKRKVTELGQIPVMGFKFSEDAKAIYKYGLGIQWSFESAFREVQCSFWGLG